MGDREELMERVSSLESIGRDLTYLAGEGIIGPIYEREDLISELASQLEIPGTNILLVGEPGTGKNAVVEGLAGWMATNRVELGYKFIVECTHISFQSFCLYAHEFETKTQMIIDTLYNHQALLFFDQINQAIGAGSLSDQPERTLANLLNPYLARQELTIIGATTPAGYKAMLKRNPAFVSRFLRLEIPATTPEQTEAILQQLQSKFETKYGIKIADQTFPTIIDLSERYLRERFFPGKAFEVLKEVIGARSLRAKQREEVIITKEDVYRVFARRTGLPDFIIYREKPIKKGMVGDYFSQRIVGQKQAVEEMVEIILNLKAELHDPQRPVGVFLFAGPTGVGKTYLARLLASFLFGSEDRLLRFDMSEYSTSDSVTRLFTGQGEERKGKLVEEVLASPFSVILFDEIEKAHPHIFNLLLGVMGEGRLTDERGTTVNFCNTIMIFTSNIGAELYSYMPIGIIATPGGEVGEKDLLRKLREYFRPEFINRLTKIVAFQPLSKEVIRVIAKKEVDNLLARKGITIRNLQIRVSQKVVDFLMEKGFNVEFGARPMQRAVERLVGYPLAEAIAEGKISNDYKLSINLIKKEKITVRRVHPVLTDRRHLLRN